MNTGHDGMTTKEDKEEFLSRWSRLKREAEDQPPEQVADKPVDPKAPAPELPALDKLTFESDYRAFFHPKVDEDVRRAALKKLFSDPRFNVMDGLDTYIDDYSKSDPIPPAMLAGLRQAQKILEWAKEDKEQVAKEQALKEARAQALEPPPVQSTPGAELRPGAQDEAAAPPEVAGTPAKS
ncbi:MAG: hypothetical protein A3I02_06900 [Betaproteobacteria bacterium RIFCSPLOWO2_02_FULL_67_26]|nr:MAG: hypothetical protein A3I02_06900 [Betaproteobacteria bacterium RIFCSPLOWO2_02_FULL_67_26]